MRLAEGGFVAVVVDGFAPAPLVTEGVGDEPFLMSVVEGVALFVAGLVRNGALVVTVETDGRPAVDRAADLSVLAIADTAPATGPAVALRMGAVDVLMESVEARGAVVVLARAAVDAAVVEVPRGFRPAVVVFDAAVVPAMEGRALPNIFLSVVEVAVVFNGALVVVVDALPASVVRALAAAVILALGLGGASAVFLEAGSEDGEGTAGSTGDSSITGSATTAASSGALSDRSSLSSRIESPSVFPLAGCPYAPRSASWVTPGACTGVGSSTARVIACATQVKS